MTKVTNATSPKIRSALQIRPNTASFPNIPTPLFVVLRHLLKTIAAMTSMLIDPTSTNLGWNTILIIASFCFSHTIMFPPILHIKTSTSRPFVNLVKCPAFVILNG